MTDLMPVLLSDQPFVKNKVLLHIRQQQLWQIPLSKSPKN